MSAYDYDLFTIGAGSGGVAASRRAGGHGAKVAICESRRVGGTCVLRGCVPKKLLVYGTDVADAILDAYGFGWHIPSAHLDWGRLIAAKNRELDRLNGIYLDLLARANVQVVRGKGRVVDPHTVEVEGQRYSARTILVATGSRPHLPDIEGIEHTITSDEALELPEIPQRPVVVGGGYIAMEFASIFHAAGSQVTVLVRGDDVLRGFDQDIRSTLCAAMRDRGIAVHTNTHVGAIRRDGDELVVTCREGMTATADVVLYATGRVPNTEGLGLERAGVQLRPGGAIEVESTCQTSVDSIYAVGDVTDRVNLTPVAVAEGRAFAESLFNDNHVLVELENVPTAVFSSPPVGTVGLSEAMARERYDEVVVYRSRFRPMKNTLSGRGEQTMMKLVVDGDSDRVLGVHMVGPDAPEIVQGFAVALKCGATKRDFDRTVGIHPSAAEEFVTMRSPID